MLSDQVFCAAPIDQRGLTGRQHCVNFVVGYSAPNLATPILVQGRRNRWVFGHYLLSTYVVGSASPLGTVFSNHSIFSIQGKCRVLSEVYLLTLPSVNHLATGGVYHPNRNGTYIQIFNRANSFDTCLGGRLWLFTGLHLLGADGVVRCSQRKLDSWGSLLRDI